MQRQAIGRHNRRAVEILSVRIGVSLGDVTIEDGDYFGMPVVEAARLCAAAEGSQILASEVVRLLGRDQDRFKPVGKLELKGLDGPVAAYEVHWEPARAAGARAFRARSPVRRRVAGSFGRGRELAALDEAWARASAGERHAVLLAGELGVGKTRLAAKLGHRAHERGARGALRALRGRAGRAILAVRRRARCLVGVLDTDCWKAVLIRRRALAARCRAGDRMRDYPTGRAIRRASASACSRPSSRSWTRRRSATRCCSCWTISTGRTAGAAAASPVASA